MAPTDNAETSFQGFWMSRPWSSAERCPHARGQAAATNGQPVTLPGQTLALAEMLPEERRRSDRSYETGQRIDRKSGVVGKSVSVSVDLGGRGLIKKKKKKKKR